MVFAPQSGEYRGSKVTDVYPGVTDVYRNGLLHMFLEVHCNSNAKKEPSSSLAKKRTHSTKAYFPIIPIPFLRVPSRSGRASPFPLYLATPRGGRTWYIYIVLSGTGSSTPLYVPRHASPPAPHPFPHFSQPWRLLLAAALTRDSRGQWPWGYPRGRGGGLRAPNPPLNPQT